MLLMFNWQLRKTTTLLWIFLFCITQLSGCGFVGRKLVSDGAPSGNVDVSKIPDAIPKPEPLSPYGNRDYVVAGHRYHVLRSARGYNKIGYASWYGTKFHGQLTSTHERYNVYSMTAASPELPLPTYVQVTNLSNGKKIIVKVNDRGPFCSNRIMDLSYAAAKKLGYAGIGTARVRVVAIDPYRWNHMTHTAPRTIPSGTYAQVAAFTNIDNAKNLARKLANLNAIAVHVTHRGNLYLVLVGPLDDAEQCTQVKQILAQHGFEHVLVVKIGT